jgi:hypothetical protein
MSAQVASTWSTTEAVRLARAVLSGEVGVLEGCIPLASIAHNVVSDWVSDPDFVVCGAVASEIDALPFGPVRERWSSAALASADATIARYTETMREQILEACRNIVARFGATTVDTPEGEGAV